MGIQGLFKLCEFAQFQDKIADLQDKKLTRIGIDMYVLLHKFAVDPDIALLLVKYPAGYIQPLYEKIKNWLINLINQGFDPYLVYDGATMNMKVTEEERALKRAIAFAKEDWIAAVEIVPEQMYNLQMFLDDLSLPYIVAPFEADAQLAYLFKTGKIDMVLTCDSDLIVYGVTRIIFIKPFKTELEWYEHKKIDEKEKPKTVNELSLEKLWLFGYLIGCDYFKGIPSIGIAKAFKLITDITYNYEGTTIDWNTTFTNVYTAIEQMVNKKTKEKLNEEELKKWYKKVNYIYTKQPVFEPDTYEIRFLTNEIPTEELLKKFGTLYNYKDHATGKINPIDNKPFELIESQCC